MPGVFDIKWSRSTCRAPLSRGRGADWGRRGGGGRFGTCPRARGCRLLFLYLQACARSCPGRARGAWGEVVGGATASGDAPSLFLRRPHITRDLLGGCLSDSSFPEKGKKQLNQSVGFQFPSRALLHQWGKEDSPNCPCRERESLGHIQSRYKVLEKTLIVVHHMMWREILQLLIHSGDEGDEQKWTIPSAISAGQHKERTVRQILNSQGLFPSDETLESKILEFFAQHKDHQEKSADFFIPKKV